MQCITDKTLLNVEGYHPSLLIDPEEKVSQPPPAPPPPVEELKSVKIQPDKKEDSKAVEGPKISGSASSLSDNNPVHNAQQLKQSSQTSSHLQPSQEIFTVATTNPRMRVASNLPPHLEQQLQQHSMMRNTAPRQQQQQQQPQSGVRMARSGSGTAWRGTAGQQNQQAVQRSASHPSNHADQRPQLQQSQQLPQGVRPGFAGQQIRAQTIQSGGPSGQHQVSGIVRQVRLVNPALQQQQQQSHVPQAPGHLAASTSEPPHPPEAMQVRNQQAGVLQQQQHPVQRVQLVSQPQQNVKVIEIELHPGCSKYLEFQQGVQNMQLQHEMQQQQQQHQQQQQQQQSQQLQPQQQLMTPTVGQLPQQQQISHLQYTQGGQQQLPPHQSASQQQQTPHNFQHQRFDIFRIQNNCSL